MSGISNGGGDRFAHVGPRAIGQPCGGAGCQLQMQRRIAEIGKRHAAGRRAAAHAHRAGAQARARSTPSAITRATSHLAVAKPRQPPRARARSTRHPATLAPSAAAIRARLASSRRARAGESPAPAANRRSSAARRQRIAARDNARSLIPPSPRSTISMHENGDRDQREQQQQRRAPDRRPPAQARRRPSGGKTCAAGMPRPNRWFPPATPATAH